jgi:hypothetical protein
MMTAPSVAEMRRVAKSVAASGPTPAAVKFRPVKQLAPEGEEPFGDRSRDVIEFTEAPQGARGNGIESRGDKFVLAVRKVVVDRATRRAGLHN